MLLQINTKVRIKTDIYDSDGIDVLAVVDDLCYVTAIFDNYIVVKPIIGGTDFAVYSYEYEVVP